MTERDDSPDAEQAVFLIHGLGGTQYDMGSMHKRLKLAGFDTHSLTLPGHGTTPEDLVGITADEWLAACRRVYADLAGRYRTLHLLGMCMGALLATEVAKQERHTAMKTTMARFPFHKSLESFDFKFQPSIDPKAIKELATCRFIADADNVLLLGPPGVGKTHLAVGFGLVYALDLHVNRGALSGPKSSQNDAVEH